MVKHLGSLLVSSTINSPARDGHVLPYFCHIMPCLMVWSKNGVDTPKCERHAHPCAYCEEPHDIAFLILYCCLLPKISGNSQGKLNM